MNSHKWHSYGEASGIAAGTPGMTELLTHQDCQPPDPRDPTKATHYTCPECGTQWTWVKPTDDGHWRSTWGGLGPNKWVSYPRPGWWFCLEPTYQVSQVYP